MVIHNGLSTSFWFDDWSSLGVLFELTGDRGFIDMGLGKYATVADAVLHPCRRRNHRSEVFRDIEHSLSLLTLTDSDDIHTWKSKGNHYASSFSSRHTWDLIRSQGQRVDWCKLIWTKHPTPKFNFITWLAVKDRLATGNRIKKWNGSYDSLCLLCKREEESRDHLFFLCDYSEKVWSQTIQNLMRNSYTKVWRDILQKMKRISGLDQFVMCYAFQTTIYFLWRERNDRKHNNRSRDITSLVRWIERDIKNKLLGLLNDKKLAGGLMLWFHSRWQ